jgi:hypothetical protein
MENMLYPDKNAAIFEELQLNCLTVKNRLFRSSISGRAELRTKRCGIVA